MSRKVSAARTRATPVPPGPALLKKWRTGRGMTQHEAALHIGIDDITYNRFERGRRMPSLKTAALIAERTDRAVLIPTWIEAG